MSGNRAFGWGLLAGAGAIVVLMVLWLLVSGAQGGGIVLGLILLVVLAGPLGGAGLYMLSRAPAEAAAEAAFAGKRRVIEADRLFRRELAGQLHQLAQRPGLPSARLEDLAADLERSSYDAPEWYDAVQLSDDDVATLRRYDDLVWNGVRSLRSASETPGASPAEAVQGLENALDQRRDLLLRGRRAAPLAPSDLARARQPARGADVLAKLAVGDAVTYEGDDFLVEGVESAFSGGRTWSLVHLEHVGPGGSDRWLYVGPAVQAVAWLTEGHLEPDAESAQVGGATARLEDRGTAAVDVISRAGSAKGASVDFSTYRGDRSFALAERWADGAVRSYVGSLVRPDEVEVWPAAVA